METIQKNDFIEIEFTGKANGEIFDTTNKEEAEKIGMENANVKPLIISVGNQMLVQGFDEALVNKEIGKKYSIHLKPEKAFGTRNPSLVKLMPIRVFREKNLEPKPGMAFQLDNYIVRILSVSGGRVSVDFNNPLAGKEIDYEFKIKRKIEDDREKVNALQDFFFKQRFEFKIEIKEKNKKVIFKNKEIKPILDILKDKFKLIMELDFEIENKENKKEENKEKKEEKINNK